MTVKGIYDLALSVMGLTQQDADQQRELELVPGMLTVLANEVKAVSDQLLRHEGKEPQQAAPVFTSIEDEVPFAQKICQSVLPYALAAKLLLEDDAARANYFNNEYLYRLALYTKPELVEIDEVW